MFLQREFWITIVITTLIRNTVNRRGKKSQNPSIKTFRKYANKTGKLNACTVNATEDISGSVLERKKKSFKDMKECLQTVHRSFYP